MLPGQCRKRYSTCGADLCSERTLRLLHPFMPLLPRRSGRRCTAVKRLCWPWPTYDPALEFLTPMTEWHCHEVDPHRSPSAESAAPPGKKVQVIIKADRSPRCRLWCWGSSFAKTGRFRKANCVAGTPEQPKMRRWQR